MLQPFTPEERFAVNLEARVDLYTFTRLMYRERKKKLWMHNWHHEVICDALMRVFNGQCKRLIINIPPRYSKTELAVVNFVAWAMGRAPDSEFIHCSYSSTLAVNNSGNVKELVESEPYQQVFPNLRLRHDKKATNDWRTTDGGVFYATGSYGTITGFGAGKAGNDGEFGGAIIVDDPHKADESLSDVRRERVIEWFKNTLESRCNTIPSTDTPIIVIMQRLHEHDLSGWLLDGGNGEEWEHLCIPALDPNTGAALWPAKHSAERLEGMMVASPYVTAGQYLQAPSPPGGSIFKADWWQTYREPPKTMWRCIYADTAQKTKEINDYSVFMCWGRTVDGRAVLLDILRGRWEAPDLLLKARAFWAKHQAATTKWNGKLRQMKVEDKVSGTGLIQSLKRGDAKKGIEAIPCVGIERSIDKIMRAHDGSPKVQAGMVLIPEESPWVSDFTAEVESFPRGAFDDQVDVMLDAIEDMCDGGTRDYGSLL